MKRRDFICTIGSALVAPLAGCVGRPGAAVPPKDYVITVRGPIAADDLGFTLPHEHVFITEHIDPSRNLSDPEATVRELALYSAAGGRTLVDLTNIRRSRQPTALRAYPNNLPIAF